MNFNLEFNKFKHYIIYKKNLLKPINLGKFRSEEFEIGGEVINEMLYETVYFSIGTYKELAENCYSGDW